MTFSRSHCENVGFNSGDSSYLTEAGPDNVFFFLICSSKLRCESIRTPQFLAAGFTLADGDIKVTLNETDEVFGGLNNVISHFELLR